MAGKYILSIGSFDDIIIYTWGLEIVSQLPHILTYFHHSCPAPIYFVYSLVQFTGHSLDLSDNVLHDWLSPHHCIIFYL